MKKHEFIKKILINISLILLNVVVFSGSFLGVEMLSGNVFGFLAGASAILFTVMIFLKVNCGRVLENLAAAYGKGKKAPEIATLKQCRAAIYTCLKRIEQETLTSGLETVIDQIDKFEAKRRLVREALGRTFDESEMTYVRFSATIDTVEAVVIGNTRVLAEKLTLLGENEYIDETIASLDEIISKMDKLLVELSELNASEFNQEVAMEDLQNLIDNVKWYK